MTSQPLFALTGSPAEGQQTSFWPLLARTLFQELGLGAGQSVTLPANTIHYTALPTAWLGNLGEGDLALVYNPEWPIAASLHLRMQVAGMYFCFDLDNWILTDVLAAADAEVQARAMALRIQIDTVCRRLQSLTHTPAAEAELERWLGTYLHPMAPKFPGLARKAAAVYETLAGMLGRNQLAFWLAATEASRYFPQACWKFREWPLQGLAYQFQEGVREEIAGPLAATILH